MALSVWLTGANGFLGTRICAALRVDGINVTTVTRPGRGGDVEWDLADAPPSTAMARFREDAPDAVIHAAAVLPHNGNPEDNVKMAQQVVRFFKATVPHPHVVFVSSISVYACPGAVSHGPFLEPPMSLFSSYGESKRRAETVLQAAIPAERLSIVRPSSIYGPKMAEHTVLPAFLERCSRGEQLRLTGPRAYRQNFVYVDDVAMGVVNAAREAIGGVFDAFGPEATSLATLANEVIGASGRAVDVIDMQTDDAWPEVAYQVAGLAALGVSPRSLREGLNCMVLERNSAQSDFSRRVPGERVEEAM